VINTKEFKECLVKKEEKFCIDRAKIQNILNEKHSWQLTNKFLKYSSNTLLNEYWSESGKTNYFYRESFEEMIFLFFLTYGTNCKIHSKFRFSDLEIFALEMKDIFDTSDELKINFKKNLYDVHKTNLLFTDLLEDSLIGLMNCFDGFIFYQAEGGALSYVMRAVMTDRWVRVRTEPMLRVREMLARLVTAFKIVGGNYNKIKEKWDEAEKLLIQESYE